MELLQIENPPHLRLQKRPETLTLAEIASRVEALSGGLAPDQKQVALGLAYLWHDHWDAAHEIAQTREGQKDFDRLHSLVHRREPDYANALYWLRGSQTPVWHPRGLANGVFTAAEFIKAIEKNPEDPELRRVQAGEFLEFFNDLIGPPK